MFKYLNILKSVNPATNTELWSFFNASKIQVEDTIKLAQQAAKVWAATNINTRLEYLYAFRAALIKNKQQLIIALSQETGKPLWESSTEIDAMIAKIDISKNAYEERCFVDKIISLQDAKSITRYKPHGVIIVLGPFNLPGHITHGHIIPALLAGNTIIFKPSEHTPLFSEKLMECWQQTKIPQGVINLLQGDSKVGKWLIKNPNIDGVFFTGSFQVGMKIQKTSLHYPNRIIALEMGGNNPLIVYQVKNIDAAVYHTIQSAFITAGQRCTCARRLIVPRDNIGEKFIEKLINAIKLIKIGHYTDIPEPFMGPMITNRAAENLLQDYQLLIKNGGKVLVPLQRLDLNTAFLKPGLIDVTSIEHRLDVEYFGPLLQLIWVKDFNTAIEEANNTNYGLAAGLLCDNYENYQLFYQKIRAGIINWNRPLTGASSYAPFGGIGYSGNHRPSAYFAADYCSYPVASLETEYLTMPVNLSPGINL